MTDPSTPQQPNCLDEQLKSRVADALLAQTEVLVIVLDRALGTRNPGGVQVPANGSAKLCRSSAVLGFCREDVC